MTIAGLTTAGNTGPVLALAAASANGMNLRDSHTMMCRIRHTSTVTTYDSTILGLQNGAAAITAGACSILGRGNGDAASELEWYRFNGSFTFNGGAIGSAGYGNTTGWTHLAFVYDSAAALIRSYINGVASTTAASATTFVTSTTNIRILVAQHPGAICDVAFFSRALTAAEIEACATTRNKPSKLANLFAWYPAIQDTLAECQKDCSGLGNHLTLQQSGANNPTIGTDSVPTTWGTRISRFMRAPVSLVSFGGIVTSPTAVTGTRATRNHFSGVATSPSGCTGTLQVRKFFTAALAGSPTACTATLAVRKLFTSAPALSPTACAGTVQSRIRFTSNICLSPTACTGTELVLTIKAFSGTCTSPTACTASANVRKPTAGTCTSPTACTASLNVRKSSSGSASSPTACTATLRVRKFFSGTATSPTACQGLQSGGTVLTPANPEDPRNSQKRRLFAVGHFHRRGRS